VGDSLARRLSRFCDIEDAYVHLDTASHDANLKRVLEQGAQSN
jgi:hypothetical protein